MNPDQPLSGDEIDEFESLLNDPVLNALAAWREPNSGEPIDEMEYRARARQYAPAFFEKMKTVFEQIQMDRGNEELP
ncbi:MAG: hypothetical protein HQL82_01835 [Magnetococcales bacterium]|nr:hypothetical protein [Magnetococcales bacterium]